MMKTISSFTKSTDLSLRTLKKYSSCKIIPLIEIFQTYLYFTKKLFQKLTINYTNKTKKFDDLLPCLCHTFFRFR
jgi:hypothetical protein